MATRIAQLLSMQLHPPRLNKTLFQEEPSSITALVYSTDKRNVVSALRLLIVSPFSGVLDSGTPGSENHLALPPLPLFGHPSNFLALYHWVTTQHFCRSSALFESAQSLTQPEAHAI
jgi:hypothetical protein